jgi:hypothetical protein
VGGGRIEQLRRKMESEYEQMHNLTIVCVFFQVAAAAGAVAVVGGGWLAAVAVAVVVVGGGRWSELHGGLKSVVGPPGPVR